MSHRDEGHIKYFRIAHFVVLACRKFHLGFITKIEIHLFDTLTYMYYIIWYIRTYMYYIVWYIPVFKLLFECYYELVTAILECLVATETPQRKYPPVVPFRISLYLVCDSLTSEQQIDLIPSRNITESKILFEEWTVRRNYRTSGVGRR